MSDKLANVLPSTQRTLSVTSEYSASRASVTSEYPGSQVSVTSEYPGSQVSVTSRVCAGCGNQIRTRHYLVAVDCTWHEDCLKCSTCQRRLAELASTLYTRDNMILCRQDYTRLFGVSGRCSGCLDVIPADELVMTAKDNIYHLNCFACQLCTDRFCVGDRFYLRDTVILCETHYDEWSTRNQVDCHTV